MIVLMVPRGVGEFLAGAAVFTLVLVVIIKLTAKKAPAPPAEPPGPTLAELVQRGQQRARAHGSSHASIRDPFHVTVTIAYSAGEYTLPPRPSNLAPGRWIAPGQSVQVADFTLPGGMIYVGSELRAPSARIDPCLIDPQLPVAGGGYWQRGSMGYWPSYAGLTPELRRAYLHWLAGGRVGEIDTGMLFLFFYGLERRVLVDAAQDAAATADFPAIAAELERLLGLYGASGSFKGYVQRLLAWMRLDHSMPHLYAQPQAWSGTNADAEQATRVALGQAAVDHVPVPPALAAEWVRAHPNIRKWPSVWHCRTEFNRLFAIRYAELFGAGMVLPVNKTRLKLSYRPGSAGLLGSAVCVRDAGAIPDVLLQQGPVKTLQPLVDACGRELEPYRHFLVQHPGPDTTGESLSLLPVALWPPDRRAKLDALRAHLDQPAAMQFADVLIAIDLPSVLDRTKARALINALASEGIGLVPDVFDGARTPTATASVVLFNSPEEMLRTESTHAYKAARLMLELAACVAWADGEFSPAEQFFLRDAIVGWAHLDAREQKRLQAHMVWLVQVPPVLSSLKKRLELLQGDVRRVVADFLIALAQADGEISPAEVRVLQKAFPLLGLSADAVYAQLHQAGIAAMAPTRTKVPTAAPTAGGSFVLDPQRLAALRADTEKVAVLLEGIFADAPAEDPEDPEHDRFAATTRSVMAEEEPAKPETALPGLDPAHAALVQLLCSRPHWMRAELTDAATDLELMLDGALEQINEAALEVFGSPLVEGSDPLDINPEVLEQLTSCHPNPSAPAIVTP